MKPRGALKTFLLLAPSLAFIVLVLLASISFVISSFSRELYEEAGRVLASRYFLKAYATTLRIGLYVTLASMALAYPLAVVGRFYYPSLKRLFDVVVFLPLMVNPLIRSFGWMIVLGRNGLLSSVLHFAGLIPEPRSFLYTELAVTLGLLELFFPFMYLSISSALENVSEDYVMAARSLGAGYLRVFADVVFPLSLTGLVTGTTIVLSGCAAAFVTPSLLGGLKVKTLSVLLREYVDLFTDWTVATVIALVILLTVLSIVGALALVRRVVARWA